MGDLNQTEATQYVSITDEESGLNADVARSNESKNELYVNSLENNKLLKDLIMQLKKMERLSYLPKNNRYISDGFGSGEKAKVDGFGSLKVNNRSTPDPDDKIQEIPVSGFFTDSAGNIDARADGSVNPVDFAVTAQEKIDTYIGSISFKIADANATLSDFGALNNGLTNGIDLIYSTQETGERVLAGGLKSNFDIIRICQGLPAFSQGVESFRASNVISNSEGYIPVLRIKDNFNLAFGLRLRAGTLDKLIIRVNDDITGLDAFDIFYYGFEQI